MAVGPENVPKPSDRSPTTATHDTFGGIPNDFASGQTYPPAPGAPPAPEECEAAQGR